MIERTWKHIPGGKAVSSDGKVLMLKMRDPSKIMGAFPQSHYRVREWQGVKFISLPLRPDSLKLLRNLGYNTRGLEVLRHRYNLPKIEGQYDPLAHQVTTAAFLSENPRAFCTSTMRTGKTASTIMAADYLQQQRLVSGVLVICTVSTMTGVWEKEIKGMVPHAKVNVLHTDGKDATEYRRKKLAEPAHYYIINYDGLKLLAPELKQAVEDGRIQCVIVDEMTHYANSQTDRWDVADQIINGHRWEVWTTNSGKKRRRRLADTVAVPYVWGLTGTPGGPEGIYGQVKLINPDKMDMFYTSWRESVMVKINAFKWVPRHGYQEIIKRHLQPCIRFDKKDIMDLPPVIFQHRTCALSKEQQKLYSRLKNEMVTQAADGTEIKAVNKAALITKLLQISCGVVRGEERRVALDMKERMDTLEEIIKESQSKVVIFAAYTAVLDRLMDELTARGHKVGLVDGRVTGKKRDKVFAGFQLGNEYDILLCHPQTTAFGVELSAADTMVFFGPPMSGEFVYQQAVERLSSLSQKADQIALVHLTATAEERKLFQSIKDGVDVNEAINNLFSEIVKQ